jgi:hypothetical protein
MLMAMKWRERGGWWRAVAAGCLFSIAVIMKQHAIVFGLIGLSLFLWPNAIGSELTWAARVRGALLFVIGGLIPLAAMVAWLAHAGVFDKFLFWTVTYARHYLITIPLSLAPATFSEMGRDVFSTSWGIWTWGMVALIAGLVARSHRRISLFFAFWLLVSFVAICPGFTFREHYFLLIVPPVAMLVGLSLSITIQWWKDSGHRQQVALMLGFGFVVVHALVISSNWETWFISTPEQASRRIYGNQGFVESVEVADYLRTNAAPTARIAVLGSEPQIFFLAQKRSATGHIYVYAMMEPQPFAHAMQAEMIHDIETTRPEFVVFAHSQASWLMRPNSDLAIIKWWGNYQAGRYEAAGFVDIGPDRSLSCWGQEPDCSRQFPNGFTVFRLRKSPGFN